MPSLDRPKDSHESMGNEVRRLLPALQRTIEESVVNTPNLSRATKLSVERAVLSLTADDAMSELLDDSRQYHGLDTETQLRRLLNHRILLQVSESTKKSKDHNETIALAHFLQHTVLGLDDRGWPPTFPG